MNFDDVQKSLKYSNQVTDKLRFTDNFFTQELLEKLYNYCTTVDSKKWQDLSDGYAQANRKVITWDIDTVVEEVTELMTNQCDILDIFFPFVLDGEAVSHNFLGASIWKDTDGYEIPVHTDNPEVSCTIQIYIGGNCNANHGTTFFVDDKELVLPFIPNCGYILNQTEPRIKHKTTKTLPKNSERYSIHFVYGYLPKKVEPTY